MRAPRHPTPYPDRHLDCQEALEDGILALLDQAEAAGWTRAEAIAAITDVADNTMLGDLEREKMERRLKE